MFDARINIVYVISFENGLCRFLTNLYYFYFLTVKLDVELWIYFECKKKFLRPNFLGALGCVAFSVGSSWTQLCALASSDEFRFHSVKIAIFEMKIFFTTN